MISQLKGQIIFKGEKFLILDVNGIGYKIYVSQDILRTLNKNGGDTSLWTHLAVRENSLDLYGFLNQVELDFFEMLITISGIGPKSALGIMNIAPIETLRRAVSSGDTSYLTKVSGIGKKIAEKIVLELRDKVGSLDSDSNSQGLTEETDALEALRSLGYSNQEAREALKGLEEFEGLSAKVKEALKRLSGDNN